MRILIRTIRFILEMLPKEQHLKMIWISFLLFINSFLELLGLGAILPVFSVLLEDDVVEKYAWAKCAVDFFHLTDENQLILVLSFLLVIIIILKNVISLWIAKTHSTFALTLFRDFALRLHKIYFKNGLTFIRSYNSNDLAKNLKIGTQQFASLQVLGSLTFLNEIIVLFLIVGFLAFYNVNVLGLVFLTVLPPFIIFYRWVRSRSIRIGKVKSEMESAILKNTFQSFFGFIDITISGSEKEFRSRIEKNINKSVEVDIKTYVYNLIPTKIIESALMLGIAIIIIYGMFYLPSKTELLKIIGLFAVAGYRIMPSINRMMIAINGMNRATWIFDVLSPLKKDHKEKKSVSKIIDFNHSLSLNNISFSYDHQRTIFDNFSLEIKKGEVVGIVGPSGGGKSTIMNIMLGFLRPQSGTYKIDGIELTNEYLESFYNKVGYVQQQVYLVDGTLAENVAFGVNISEIDYNKLQLVLEKASLKQLVKTLPDGVHEMIGENGTKLSGGQRQRVGIARALYFDAEILFFDEATSALDSETEKEITDSINNLSDGKLTLIIIAHRLSTLESCNRIIEIDTNQSTTAKNARRTKIS